MTVLLGLQNHRHIINVSEVVVGSDQTKIFMVMEYMEHDMKGLLTDMKNYFTQAEVKRLMLQLLSAVDCLHDNWIIHRDIKVPPHPPKFTLYPPADFQLVAQQPRRSQAVRLRAGQAVWEPHPSLHPARDHFVVSAARAAARWERILDRGRDPASPA